MDIVCIFKERSSSSMLSTKKEKELLRRCRRGDQQAQMEVYDRFYHAMFNTALRIVKEPQEAEDVMQEAFLKAFSKLHTFKGESSFGTWLKRIVANQSIVAYRRIKAKQEVSLDHARPYEVSEPQGLALEEESYNPRFNLAIRSLENLRESYRIILTLNLIEGFDQQEICEILKITPANCRTTLSRARESLRKKILSYEE